MAESHANSRLDQEILFDREGDVLDRVRQFKMPRLETMMPEDYKVSQNSAGSSVPTNSGWGEQIEQATMDYSFGIGFDQDAAEAARQGYDTIGFEE